MALLLLSFTGIAFAQSTEDLFHSSGGQVSFTFKSPSRLSGSLGLTLGRSAFGSFGGTIVKDRLWFFAAGEHQQATARFDNRLSTSFANRETLDMTPASRPDDLTRRFLTLRSTGILSDRSFLTVTVTGNQQ